MTEPFDIRAPLPDVAHEALRVGLLEVVDGLAVQVQRMEGVLLLLLTTSDFAQGTKNTAMAARGTLAEVDAHLGQLAAGGAALQQAVGALAQTVGGLTRRVAALEELAPSPPDLPLDLNTPEA